MPTLRELQHQVRRALLDGADGAPVGTLGTEVLGDGLTPDARLGIYRHHVLTTLTSLTLLASPWPVEGIWRANQPEADAEATVDLGGDRLSCRFHRTCPSGEMIGDRATEPTTQMALVHQPAAAAADGACALARAVFEFAWAQQGEEADAMAETGERDGDEIRGNAGDVTARAVTIRQGGARSVAADAVTVRQGGIGRLRATDVEIIQGGVGLATVGNLRVTAGATGLVVADTVVLEQSMAKAIAARERVEMDQAAAGIVAGGSVHVRDSVIGVLLTPRFEGREGVRVLMGPQAAFAFGAGIATVLYLVGLWYRSGKSSS